MTDQEGWQRVIGGIPRGLQPLLAQAARADSTLLAGRYRLLEPLGEGAMAAVYRAEDVELHRIVAVKVLKDALAAKEAMCTRFRREAQAAARVLSPNLVTVFDVGEDGGRQFIVMEYVPGESLAACIGRRGPLPAMLDILEKVARAMHHAHVAGVIHRDLKPANILLTAAGEPKVGDFGLARFIEGGSGVTLPGTRLGTPLYMAPEQALGKIDAVSPRTDVYALGAILYEALTGRPPHEGRTVVEVYARIVGDEPTRPRRFNGSVPREVEAICLRALEKEQPRRYASALEFAEDLRRYRSGEPILARPPSLPYRLRKLLARRRWQAVLAIGLVVFLAGGAVGLRSLQEARHYRALKRRVAPIEDLIRESRPMFYSEGIDVRARLAQVGDAVRELEALAADPVNARTADLWSAIGIGWHFVGDGERAERALLKAQELDPGDGRVAFELGRIYIERFWTSRLRLARRGGPRPPSKRWLAPAFEQMRKASGGEPLLIECYTAFAADDHAHVEECCQRALAQSTDVGSEEYWMLRGSIRRELREQCEALDAALRIRPHYPWGRLMRGTLRAELGDLAGAVADYDRALEVSPRWSVVLNNRSTVHLTRGDFDRAIADATAALESDPDGAHVLINRGNAYSRKRDWDRALADFDEAIRRMPALADGYSNRSAVWLDRDEHAKARADAQRAVELDPNYAEAYANRGTARSALGDRAGAAADYDKAIELDPALVGPYLNRSSLRAEGGDVDGAFADINAALAAGAPRPLALTRRGELALRRGDPAAARRDFDDALRLDASLLDSYLGLARALEDTGDRDGAVTIYTLAIERSPRLAIAWCNRGLLRSLLGDTAAGIADLTRAVTIEPAYTLAFYNRGLLHQSRQELDEAIADYSRAIELDPVHWGAWANRAGVFYAKGDEAKTIEGLEHVLKSAPAAWPSRAAAEELLRQIRAK